ncbi:ATP synthase F1 subunit gamma [Patescibacteria group bacterium]|nr:ATP synthase F1 subunit gamma [Patescibacteria group bacterium]
MASLNYLKKRINGVKSINQITSAMELVAATKMRKAQEVALASRFYAFDALEILGNLINSLSSAGNHKHLFERRVKKTAVLLVTSDKGLVGSFNGSVLKRLDKFIKSNDSADIGNSLIFITVGQKGTDYVKKIGFEPVKSFSNYSDVVALEKIIELSDFLEKGYRRNEWDRIISFSTNFTSALSQEVVERQILPFDTEKIRKTIEDVIPKTGRYSELRKNMEERRAEEPLDYIMEPNAEEIIEDFLPHLLKIEIYHLMLEANASEHSSRRMTMKNASDNAEDLTNELTLEYNKSRQEMITRELGELTGTVAAITQNI